MMYLLRLFICVAFSGVFAVARAQEQDKIEPIPVFHPMDALTAEEVVTAARLLHESGNADQKSLFGAMTLLEPPKDIVLQWRPEMPLPARQAFVVIRRNGKTYEARVDISNLKVLSVEEKPGKHPIVLDDNWTRARDAFLKDDRYKQALKKRGLENSKNILCTPNSAGWFPGENEANRHILKVPCYSVADMMHPALARPIEGLMGVVDAETGEVLQVFDGGVVDLPPPPAGYGDNLPKQKPAIARLSFNMEGVGNLKLSGNLNVEWLDWRFHVRPDKRGWNGGFAGQLQRWQDVARHRLSNEYI